jgi:hypothetical protein
LHRHLDVVEVEWGNFIDGVKRFLHNLLPAAPSGSQFHEITCFCQEVI